MTMFSLLCLAVMPSRFANLENISEFRGRLGSARFLTENGEFVCGVSHDKYLDYLDARTGKRIVGEHVFACKNEQGEVRLLTDSQYGALDKKPKIIAMAKGEMLFSFGKEPALVLVENQSKKEATIGLVWHSRRGWNSNVAIRKIPLPFTAKYCALDNTSGLLTTFSTRKEVTTYLFSANLLKGKYDLKQLGQFAAERGLLVQTTEDRLVFSTGQPGANEIRSRDGKVITIPPLPKSERDPNAGLPAARLILIGSKTFAVFDNGGQAPDRAYVLRDGKWDDLGNYAIAGFSGSGKSLLLRKNGKEMWIASMEDFLNRNLENLP